MSRPVDRASRPLAPQEKDRLGEGELSAPALETVLEVLALHARDLSDYRLLPLGRRVVSRMEALGLTDVSVYVERLRRDVAEAGRLADSLLVQVTSFFRDRAVFEALRERVLPELVRRARARNRPLHAWVVGAATGQEAYSLAMILADLSSSTGVPFEVLATDRSDAALAYARRGLYTDEELASLPLDVRRRFVVGDPAGGFRVQDHLRQRVQFHDHDLLGPRLSPRQSIVASFDVVLCRNVLIYLEPRAQALVFARFSDIVMDGGALVLGHAEAAPVASTRFAAFPGVDPALRIFARTAPRGADVEEGSP